jgi:hypothetical protein
MCLRIRPEMLAGSEIMTSPARQPPSKVELAIAQLTSLHDGDLGVIAAIACGPSAISPLKAVLFSREPSGFYETRRRAVEALEGLGAFDVLRDYLRGANLPTDPVERTGDDAVMGAAAKALGHRQDARDLRLLWHLLRDRPLAGVIDAVGRFRQPATLPHMIKALGDDFLRPSAEAAIRKLGRTARRSLVEAALNRQPPVGNEPMDSVNRRRSALMLLEEISPEQCVPFETLRMLTEDTDAWIALRAARLCLPHLPDPIAKRTVSQLILLLQQADALLAEEISEVLVKYYRFASAAIDAFYREPPSEIPPWRSSDHTRQAFDRVLSHVLPDRQEGPSEQ